MCFERFLKTPLSPSTSRRRCLKTSLFFSPCIKEVSSRCRSFWSHSLHRECITGDLHFQELSNRMSHPSRRQRGRMKAKNVLEVNPGCGRILDALGRVFIPDLILNINSGILDSSAQGKRKNKCLSSWRKEK